MTNRKRTAVTIVARMLIYAQALVYILLCLYEWIDSDNMAKAVIYVLSRIPDFICYSSVGYLMYEYTVAINVDNSELMRRIAVSLAVLTVLAAVANDVIAGALEVLYLYDAGDYSNLQDGENAMNTLLMLIAAAQACQQIYMLRQRLMSIGGSDLFDALKDKSIRFAIVNVIASLASAITLFDPIANFPFSAQVISNTIVTTLTAYVSIFFLTNFGDGKTDKSKSKSAVKSTVK